MKKELDLNAITVDMEHKLEQALSLAGTTKAFIRMAENGQQDWAVAARAAHKAYRAMGELSAAVGRKATHIKRRRENQA